MERVSNVKSILVVNLKINIASSGSGDTTIYDARVEDVRSGSFLISYPTDKGVPISAHKGMRLEISFISHGGRFYCVTKVLNRVIEKLPMLELELPEYLDKSELREFFRIDVLRKVKLFQTRVEVKPQVGKVLVREPLGEAFCMDISGGGTRLLSEKAFYNIRDVDVDFGNTIEGLDSLAGTIVRHVQNAEGKYDVGVKFNSMRDNDRDKIIKYVFKRQIEMRKLQRG